MDLTPRNEDPVKPPMLFNKQLTVFLVCLSISIIFWLLQALSALYPATIEFPVQYKNFPSRKVIVNELPAKITLDLKTSGFRIIYHAFEKQKEPISIDVASGMNSSGIARDAITIPTRNFINDFTRQLGNDIEVTAFHPDSIVLLFNDKISKKVAVKPVVSFTLQRQYDTLTKPYTVPDSVIVSGPPGIIHDITSVQTVANRFVALHEHVDRKTKLQLMPAVDVEPEEVRLKVDVEKFTEGEQVIAIHAINVPSGFTLKTFPEKVKVRYQAALSQYSKIDAQQFEVVVDAGAIPDANVNLLPLHFVSKPASVRSVSLDPAEVEFIFRKK